MSKPFQVEDILKVLEFAEKYGSPNLKNFEMFKAFKVDVFNLCDQHTPDHINCPACESADLLVKADLLGMAKMKFPDAAELWMKYRRLNHKIRERTHETNDDYIRALKIFFNGQYMSGITPGMLKSYQEARLNNLLVIQEKGKNQAIQPWKKKAGHSRVNHELNCLSQMLRDCKEWPKLKSFYFPLTIPSWSPREILTEEQEEELFRKAAGVPEASLAYCVAVITNNTTASGIEIRGLRLKDIFLRPPDEISDFYIRETKGDQRPRRVPMNRAARWAFEQLYKRAIKLGCSDPEHFLIPFRNKKNFYEPDKMSSRWVLRRSWNILRQLTGFKGLRPHDLRHHCITKMLEQADVNPETVFAMAGHIGEKMMRYYSHQRIKAKFAAASAIEPTFEMKVAAAEGRRRHLAEKRRQKEASRAKLTLES
jgi:integrase